MASPLSPGPSPSRGEGGFKGDLEEELPLPLRERVGERGINRC